MQGRSTKARPSGHALLSSLSQRETQESSSKKNNTFINTRCIEKSKKITGEMVEVIC